MGGFLKKVPTVNGGESPAVADPRSTSTGDGDGGGLGASPATATPITPSSSSSRFVNVVSLYDWWLTKIKGGDGVFRLGVGGFSTKGQHAPRLFLSAPIVRRRDTFTLESEDNNTILIHNLVNRQRTLDNGFPPEACDFFLMGFPYNWKVCAEQYCGEPKSTSNPLITPCSGNPSKSSAVNSGQAPSFSWDELPIHRVHDLLNSTPGTPDDQLRKSLLSEIMRTFSVHSSRRATSGRPVDVENSTQPMMRSLSKHVMTATSKEQGTKENSFADMNKCSSQNMASPEPRENKTSGLRAGENGIGECGESLLSVQPDNQKHAGRPVDVENSTQPMMRSVSEHVMTTTSKEQGTKAISFADMNKCSSQNMASPEPRENRTSGLHAGENGIGECGESLLSAQLENQKHAGKNKPGTGVSGEYILLETSKSSNGVLRDFMFQENTEMVRRSETMSDMKNKDRLSSAKCWRPITRSMSKHVMTGTSKDLESKTTDMNKFSSETMVSPEPKETKSSALHAGEDGIGECGDSFLSVQPDNHYHGCRDSLLPIPPDNHNHAGSSKPGTGDSGEHCFLETSNPSNNSSHDFMFQEKTEMIKLPESMTILQNEGKLNSAMGKLKENNTVGQGPADSEALTDEDNGVARKLNFLSSPSPINGNQKLIIGHVSGYRATAIKRGKNCISPSIENETTEEIQNETTEEIHLNNSVQAKPSSDKASSKLRRRKQKSSPFVQLNQSPITRERAKELSCVTPESLNCKRSRSGRLLVPRLDPGLNQRLIYDMEGTVTGIKTCADVPVSPWKGPTSKLRKRRK
ncbi:hypothetical protein QJS04_geneDACA023483 [Acorus gramineus]|uniref:SANTA domain-containing protein n=1 Tax=Acorus gramineus TaxID=55184 RepID=A0AAV9B737_ACOGR|nr:hypothetical protein QJS04_geneDACA023483 [Acorus gramineus]